MKKEEEKMKEYQKESNITIVINALREIIEIFSGPFLTTYFIKTSSESIIDIAIYNIICYLLLLIGSVIVGYIIKNKFKMATFRMDVIINFIYILSIIILREKVIEYLWLLAILYGLATSLYYMPFNLFLSNKVKNEDRTGYEVKKKLVSSIINIFIPILLGSIITVTNYTLTAIIILIISLIQIILSFILNPLEESGERFHIKKIYTIIKQNKDVKRMMLVEYLTGLSVNYSALSIITTILIYNTFHTDFNLGIITSIAYILQLLVIYLYGKWFKENSDKHIIILLSLMPIIILCIFLIYPSDIMVIVYNLCYTIFVNVLGTIRIIRLYNISNSKMINRTNQEEFWSVREISINLGRITSFIVLLFAGITGSNSILNIVMVVLTLLIFGLGYILSKIDREEIKKAKKGSESV